MYDWSITCTGARQVKPNVPGVVDIQSAAEHPDYFVFPGGQVSVRVMVNNSSAICLGCRF